MSEDRSYAHWSDYWSNGYLTSLPADFQANYDGEVAEFWDRQFRDAPDGARVLDLCTGNGAIALLAARHGEENQRAFDVTAVDAAQVDTAAVAERFPDFAPLVGRVRFRGGLRVEDLETGTERYDLVTSQFGIEYCDWQTAGAKISELLAPGGRFALVSHESTSDILRYMEQEYREYQLVEQLGFHSTVRAFLRKEMRYADMKANMRRAQDQLARIVQQNPSPFLRSMHNGINGLVTLSKSALRRNLEGLHRFQRQTALGQARLEDMLRVNRAIAEHPDWHQAFAVGGVELVDSGDLYYRGRHHAGRYYRFLKA